MTALRVAMRADASPVLGSGHVMRCLSLAEALRTRGALVHFICRDGPGNMADHIRAQGFTLTLLAADLHPGQDAIDTRAAVAAGCHLLVVDHYGLGAAWEQALRPACQHLAAIDDLADRPHTVDLLLDQNLGRAESDYSTLLPAGARRLIGPQFALLRPDFAATRATSLARRPAGGWRRLLISLGGADPQQATVQVLQALAGCPLPPETTVTVVLGALASTRPQVQARLPTLPCASRLLVDVADMASLLADADLAIGAAGGSAWERCCLGLPSLLLVLAHNQRPGTQALVAAGAALALGGVADLPTALPAALQALAAPGRLPAMSQAAAAITDGRGAARVADALLALPCEVVRAPRAGLRPARPPRGSSKVAKQHLLESAPTMPTDTLQPLQADDLATVRAWRNHPDVRRHMFSTHAIGEAEHRQWFARQQADPLRRLWLFCRGGQPMGFVHLSGAEPGGVAEWGFYAAPGAPKGTGRALGQAALARAFGPERLHKVCGQVLAGNAASLALHRRLGFAEEGLLRQQHHGGAHYHDVHCFGLLRADWPAPDPEPAP